ncbi:MAG: exodeoxyribonuclease III [Alphaproteobacteria bacterium]
MKIATWNVNSVRLRLPQVLAWWQNAQPDVLCLQETKVVNDDFPLQAFSDMGLHVAMHGQKSYNGVALISRTPLSNIRTGFAGDDLEQQTRVLTASVVYQDKMLDVMSVYAPQGESTESPKFAFKRRFYSSLYATLSMHFDAALPLVVCGDFNIAREARDVDDAAKRAGHCMFTPEEHEWLQELESFGLHDSFRIVSPEAGVFSWWDYRQAAFQRNRGMRIDMLYVSNALKQHIKDVDHFKEERTRTQPSDHVPVMLTLKAS